MNDCFKTSTAALLGTGIVKVKTKRVNISFVCTVNKDGLQINKSVILLLSALLDLLKQYARCDSMPLSIFQTNFNFPWRFKKSGFHCMSVCMYRGDKVN